VAIPRIPGFSAKKNERSESYGPNGQRRVHRAADDTEATGVGQDQFAAAERAIKWPAGKKAAIFEPATEMLPVDAPSVR
jgi:hypothetical protein